MPFTEWLTVEHWGWISQECADWLGAARSTEPVDRPAAEAAVRRVYEAAGLQSPRLVVWVDSPYGCVLAGALTEPAAQFPEQLRKQLWRQLYDRFAEQLGDHLANQLHGQLWDQLRPRLLDELRLLWGPLLYQFEAWLEDQLVDQLEGQSWDQLGSQFWDQLRDQLGNQFGVHHADPPEGHIGDRVAGGIRRLISNSFTMAREAFSIAAYTLAFRIVGLPVDPRLEALAGASCHLSWWIPLRDVAIVAERPTALHLDEQGHLHNPAGPAITYPDGWGVWAWHGVRVEPWVIIDPTPEAIAAEPNVEVRRAAIEVLGWDAYIRQAGLALVGEADDPGNPGQRLALYDMPEQVYGAPVRVLLCANGTVERDGTRRRYGLTVPATISDPVEAAGWTYGLTRDQYALLRRRT